MKSRLRLFRRNYNRKRGYRPLFKKEPWWKKNSGEVFMGTLLFACCLFALYDYQQDWKLIRQFDEYMNRSRDRQEVMEDSDTSVLYDADLSTKTDLYTVNSNDINGIKTKLEQLPDTKQTLTVQLVL